MGYSLYITRREHWYEEGGPEIALPEWQRIVESDESLAWEPALGDHVAVWTTTTLDDPPWLGWDQGQIESKYPDTQFIRKLFELASQLDARVVGDDGEQYGSDGVAVAAPRKVEVRSTGFWSNLMALFWSRESAPSPPFGVGARVRGVRGRLGTVTKINLRSQGGMGEIHVRYDDGQKVVFAAAAHTLEPVQENAGGV